MAIQTDEQTSIYEHAVAVAKKEMSRQSSMESCGSDDTMTTELMGNKRRRFHICTDEHIVMTGDLATASEVAMGTEIVLSNKKNYRSRAPFALDTTVESTDDQFFAVPPTPRNSSGHHSGFFSSPRSVLDRRLSSSEMEF